MCLAWAATSALDASRYIADAPYERLQLIGGDHDWAFFFSADGIDAMERAAGTASAVAGLGWLLYAAAFGAALWPVAAMLLPRRTTAAGEAPRVPVRGTGRPIV